MSLNEDAIKSAIEEAHGPNFMIIVGDSASEALNNHLLERADGFDEEEHGDFKDYILDTKDEKIEEVIDNAAREHGLSFSEGLVKFDCEEAEEVFYELMCDIIEDNSKTYEGLGI